VPRDASHPALLAKPQQDLQGSSQRSSARHADRHCLGHPLIESDDMSRYDKFLKIDAWLRRFKELYPWPFNLLALVIGSAVVGLFILILWLLQLFPGK
jgi:hypothetical protein